MKNKLFFSSLLIIVIFNCFGMEKDNDYLRAKKIELDSKLQRENPVLFWLNKHARDEVIDEVMRINREESMKAMIDGENQELMEKIKRKKKASPLFSFFTFTQEKIEEQNSEKLKNTEN